MISNENDTTKHYMPYHAVINQDKTSTKVGIVHDAPGKINKGHESLNECLYSGSTMLKDLSRILLRFCLNKIAIVSDIEKAFLQIIGLQEDAKDVTRIFWLKSKSRLTVEKNIQVYRFNKVPFRIISSPLLLAETLDYHLKAKTVREKIYEDKVVTGKDTVKEAVDFYIEAKKIFRKASMNLRDWLSNNNLVMKEIPGDDRASRGPMKILGLT